MSIPKVHPDSWGFCSPKHVESWPFGHSGASPPARTRRVGSSHRARRRGRNKSGFSRGPRSSIGQLRPPVARYRGARPTTTKSEMEAAFRLHDAVHAHHRRTSTPFISCARIHGRATPNPSIQTQHERHNHPRHRQGHGRRDENRAGTADPRLGADHGGTRACSFIVRTDVGAEW